MKKEEVWFKKSRLLNPLIAFYFFVAFIEVIAEYNNDYFFITRTKPLVIPLLIAFYLIASRTKNKYYLTALLLVFISNLFLLSAASFSIIMGSTFLLLSQLLFIYVVMQNVKFPGFNLMVISSLPFACICFLVAVLVHDTLGLEFYLFLIEAILIIFLGGLCLSNYLLKYNKSNSQLLASALLFSIAQLLFILGSSNTNSVALTALSNVCFVVGHYIFYLFVVAIDKKQKRYKIIN